jgi:hypothetical protein
MFGRKTAQRKTGCFSMWFNVRQNEEILVDRQGSKATMLLKHEHVETSVQWRSNKKTWMTSQIMEELLTVFNDNENAKLACFVVLE